jgi:cardiolipin synthase A/B
VAPVTLVMLVKVKNPIMWLIGVALAAFVVGIIVLNLTSSPERIEARPSHLYPVADPQFVRSLGVLLGPPFAGGNQVDTLINGDRIFPAMLEAIDSAQQTINFESYIYWSGEVGRRFAESLSARARAGVKVHLLVDWVGSQKMDDESVRMMEEGGVEIRKYRPLHWYHLARMNNRTHRKLLVVDGKIGFTGGVGIADEWSGDAQDPEHWRDTHYRIVGPAVAQLQAAFMDNWIGVSGDVLHGDLYFPPLEPAGEQYAQMFTSSSEGGSDSMHLMYLLSIAAATKTIDLAMAYFVPDEIATEALVEAAKRGVRIRIIVPGRRNDTEFVRRASRAKWGPLLEAGAEIYEYQPTMYHVKLMIVDRLWSSVGSTNFDNRSFRLNDEANLNVFDAGFAVEQTAMFEADLARSRRIGLAEWQSRPWLEKLLEHTAALAAPQL